MGSKQITNYTNSRALRGRLSRIQQRRREEDREKAARRKPGKKRRTHDGRPDDVSRNVKIEMAISVISNRSVDEESESDSRGGFLQIAQGREESQSLLIQQH